MEKRVHGGKDIALIECINPRLQKYRVRWDLQPYYDEEMGEERGVTFIEKEFLYKPSIGEVKDTILSWMNEQIDNKIVSGFYWQGMSVWLSAENQFNYKAAYDLATQTQGGNLPVVFKFGDTQNPVYHTFYTLDELGSFYLQAMAYINEQLQWGWETKDSIDWGEYEKQLNAI